jgi:hypothetical protein
MIIFVNFVYFDMGAVVQIWMFGYINPFIAEIKSLCATVPDEIFYWGFCLLDRAFR